MSDSEGEEKAEAGAAVWKYMSIRTETFARLDRQRQKMAKKMGFKKLSWTNFFAQVADKLEKKAV